MSVLPPAGPQRTRLVVLLTLLGVALVYFVWRGSGSSSTPPAAAPPAASNQQVARAGTPGKPAAGATMPVPVNLDKLEPVPDEPGAGRNLFRFGVPPAPPPPPPPPPPVMERPAFRFSRQFLQRVGSFVSPRSR